MRSAHDGVERCELKSAGWLLVEHFGKVERHGGLEIVRFANKDNLVYQATLD